MRPTEKKVASVLSRRGYKLTPQRRAVLNVIVNRLEHLTPSEVYERVHRDHPSVGLVTVYRTLEVLSELGLLSQVHRVGSARSYTLTPLGHHHHLICSLCGVVADFTDCGLEELEQRLSQDTRFKIEGHLLQFVGRCRDCQQAAVA